MMNKIVKRCLALLLLAAILVNQGIYTAYAATDSLESLQGQIDAAKERLANLKGEAAGASQLLDQVNTDLSQTGTEIASLESQMAATKEDIKATKKEQALLDGQMDDLSERIGNHMNLVQVMSHTNYLVELLASSNSLTDLVRNIRFIIYLSQMDADLVDELQGLISKQEIVLENLQKKEEEEHLQSEKLAFAKDQLEKQAFALNTQLQNIADEQMAESDVLRVLEESKRAAEDALHAAENGNSSASGGGDYGPESVFTANMTAYNANCKGCSARVACTGMDVSSTITYNDGAYGNVRIIAADRSTPCGTIINIEGIGNAIVLDRGSAITGNKLDLLVEGNTSGFGRQSLTASVVRWGW